MDIFKKQQTIETARTVIKARWFYVLAIVAQGIIVKIWLPGIPLPSGPLIVLIVVCVLVFNLGYWIYLRRPLEKISNLGLKTILVSQVPLELLGLSAILYFSGTANKMLLMMYIIPIMVGSSLYKTKGIVLSTLAAAFLYSGLAILEYFGLLPELSLEAISQSPTKLLKGELTLIKEQLIGFNLYILAAAIYAGYLAGLFKRREKRLVSQKDELAQKTQTLAQQTQELAQTKDWLHDALVKSDKARVELQKTKEELEKVNLELMAKIEELEKYSKVTVGRELKMAELKTEIKNLRETIKNLQDQLD